MNNTGLSKAALDKMDAAMGELVASGEIPGIVALVSRGGDVHVTTAGTLSIGGAPVQRDSIFRIASISKPVTAVGAMMLVDEGFIALDEPVDEFIPELANRRVLKRLDGPLDETVQANRPITLRDLFTMTMGLGYLMWSSEEYPINQELKRLNLLQGPPHPAREPGSDDWIGRVGSLPLMHQPGEKWMYDISAEVIGILIERASGQSLDEFLLERIFGPLGMVDTAFYCPEAKIHRFATSYEISEDGLKVYDPAAGGEWSQPPAFCQAAGGLVSTVDDFLKFGKMMLNGGELNGVRILSPESVAAMTRDQVSSSQKQDAELFLGEQGGWGFGMSVRPPSQTPSGYGWDGGLGTSWYNDPEFDLTGILLTQVSWTSPVPPQVREDFWTFAYEAVR